jgi:Holliday junction resolvase RusA-like endonuclease
MITLTLPWPPTVNTYWRHVGGRVLVSSAGRAYREEVAWLARTARANLGLEGPLKMEAVFHPPDRRRRDIDNLCKALLDAMQTGGVYRDDSQIIDLHLKLADVVPSGRVKVAIEEIETCPTPQLLTPLSTLHTQK